MSLAPERTETQERRRRQGRDAWPTEETWDDRISDRVNPILVRDLTQNGNSPMVTIAVVLASIAIIRIGSSMLPQPGEPMAMSGRHGFEDLAVLVARICWALVPFLTFISMRDELTGTTSESLLLSGLTPSRIVLGKILSALLLTAVIVALASPLFGMAFLLRGMSLPTLMLSFGFGVLSVIALSACAVAGACACRDLRPQALSVALAAAAFGALALVADPLVPLLISALDSAVVARAGLEISASALVLVFFAAATWLIGTTSLAHSYDNRSTGFRILGLALPVTALLLLWTISDPAALTALAPLVAVATLVATTPIWACAVTEGRNRPLLRRPIESPLGRVLTAPLAPGRGNALLWVLLLGLTTAALGLGLPALGSGARPSATAAATWLSIVGPNASAVCVLSLSYLLLYAGLGATVRAVLDRRHDPRAWWLARATLPIVVLASWSMPLIINGVRGTRSVEWNLAHLINPITTTAQVAREGLRPDLLLWILGLSALLWLPCLATMSATLQAAWRGPDEEDDPRHDSTEVAA